MSSELTFVTLRSMIEISRDGSKDGHLYPVIYIRLIASLGVGGIGCWGGVDLLQCGSSQTRDFDTS